MNWTLGSAADWIAWVALIVSFATIAWSALRYVRNETRKIDQSNFENSYKTLERIHNREGALILQLAAVYELRNFPEYRDLSIRLCEASPYMFGGAGLQSSLTNEFELTKIFLEQVD